MRRPWACSSRSKAASRASSRSRVPWAGVPTTSSSTPTAASSWNTVGRTASPTPTCCLTRPNGSPSRVPRTAPTGALVLTAGLGTRLRPLTADRAKPALPVAGPTLVERILDGLSRQGIDRVLLNLHYRPETITAIVGDGSALGLQARYSWEVPLLGSGGGPRRAFSLVPDDRLWLINGDTLTDVDLAVMAAEHAASDALVTMAVIPNPAPDRYGGVVVSPQGEVTAFVPRGSSGPTWHFVGVQIAEREGLPRWPTACRPPASARCTVAFIAARSGSCVRFGPTRNSPTSARRVTTSTPACRWPVKRWWRARRPRRSLGAP